MENKKLENAKNLYLEGIRDGNARAAVTKYTGERYTQHSTGVKDGVEGFVEFFEPFLKRNPKRQIEIVRGWQDGQYVFVHVFQSLNDGEAKWVTTDFFDTDTNDKIIEHWDVIAAFTESNPSGRSSIDGATEFTDLDKTEENKILVRNFINDVLSRAGDCSKIDTYLSTQKYLEHNKERGDGIENFRKWLDASETKRIYEEIVLCVGKGNFVATLSKVLEITGETKHEIAQVDILRIDNGKIVEHWDNAEPVPEENVNSGKF